MQARLHTGYSMVSRIANMYLKQAIRAIRYPRSYSAGSRIHFLDFNVQTFCDVQLKACKVAVLCTSTASLKGWRDLSAAGLNSQL